ncbi:MAG: pentapeptide repeat-containing protein [Gemmatimonadetes bacterium]|nr:pentapeptide repeat-containing protein [Gemmatimonadota bacterium]
MASPNAQLLKSSSTLFGPSCELAHDGIGGALLDWSSSELLSVDEVRASPVSLGGQDFAWDDSALTGQFHYMCWLTCRLSGVTLKGVEFLHCTFKGMLFEDCTFIDCAFIDCDLSGAMFLGGSIGARRRVDSAWTSAGRVLWSCAVWS